MYYVDTKGLGPKRTQKCIDALVTLGYKRVDGIEGMHPESKCELKYGELRCVGVTCQNSVMMYPRASNFAEGATPITYNKLMEMVSTDGN